MFYHVRPESQVIPASENEGFSKAQSHQEKSQEAQRPPGAIGLGVGWLEEFAG